MISTFMVLCLMVESAPALTRKSKPTGSDKTKTADSIKPVPASTASQSKGSTTVTPAIADSTQKNKVTPTKFNDFVDKNKNGIDDRAEKTVVEPKKPAETNLPTKSKTKSSEVKKPSETKKSSSEGASKTSSKKSK